MRRVLVLAYFFPPLGGGGCQRTLKLVRYLEPHGWRSTVVTTHDRDYWILDPSLLAEVPSDTEVLRVGGWTTGRIVHAARGLVSLQERQGARRPGAFRALRAAQRWTLLPDGYRGWSRAARRAAEARLREGDVDALWTTSSPESAHLAGLSLREKHRIPWVADFRDPWVGRVTYRPPTRWHDAWHRTMERRVVEAADRVTLVSEAMVDLYRSRYPEIDPSRFRFLPNGFDSDDWRRADREVAARGENPGSDTPRRFVVLHAGQLAHRPTARTLLEAARLVLERDRAAREELRLRFMGGLEEISAGEAQRYGLGATLETKPSVPHIESLIAMRRASALALLGHGGSADSLLYTGKLYEYVSSGRPVLAIADEGPATRLIRSTRAGVVVRPGDVEGAAETILGWLSTWRAGKDLVSHVDPGLLSVWERRTQALEASEILSEIASRNAR